MSPLPWAASLSAVDRLETVRFIRAAHTAAQAVAIEQRIYESSTSREEYYAACSSAAKNPTASAVDTSSDTRVSGPTQPRVRIGAWHDCEFVSEGVTSRVYRSGDSALKVIVARAPLEPHNPQREANILRRLRPPCIPLLDVFRDHEQRLVLRFPYLPLTLSQLIVGRAISLPQLRTIVNDTLRALEAIHGQGIIHRDIKPSAILVASADGPAFLSDFGTAWHPELCQSSEPAHRKILDIGTGPYRAPEVLFANRSYGPPVDMWGLGVIIAEAINAPPRPLFESRPAHEDGNQLGLILSIFKTIGTPTRETWPEADGFPVSPFELWTVFPARPWEEILPNVDKQFRELVAALVRFDGRRVTAAQVRICLIWIPSGADSVAGSQVSVLVGMRRCGTVGIRVYPEVEALVLEYA
ncbi:hypothetical protein CDD80_3073 [Ophiocordyceps camponoti-rufipedis]|uniref:cyclin-dependent kinase n=1 Tax=Ophiocordyceps camponoti-rufipedis TaxID=2004952 RepID=A0A2C5Z507_9HYPO|nr:hypothetical protein CDD80_3073 [Ophiocordyceps camponoti-rufipedis]